MDTSRKSVILIPVPNAEAIVGKWREKYDPVALHGIRAHITVLFPFKDPEIIDQRVTHMLRKFFSGIPQFEFYLTRINTFPGVIYLEPEPKEKFVELIQGITEIFPENPWFEGAFTEIIPHLTIGNKLQNVQVVEDEISKDISSKLPIKTLAKEAWIMESKDDEWFLREKFPFRT